MTDKIWDDDQCPNLGSHVGKTLEQCTQLCTNTAGCTAINYSQTSHNGDCILRKCGNVVPVPKWDYDLYVGYYRKATEGCADMYNDCPKWASQGSCSHTSWMAKKCKNSCGLCQVNPGLTATCTDIKIVTKSYGSENSWTFGSCSSSPFGYATNQVYTEKCCQPAGSYDFICKDSYGDGWHGGYIQIGGSEEKLCLDFTSGGSKTIVGVANVKFVDPDW